MANLSCLAIQLLTFLLLLIGRAHSVSFNFSGFLPNTGNLTFEGDAFTSSGGIQLTRNQQDNNLQNSIGRVSYDKPVRLWDSKTGRLTDFTAHFSFVINALNNTYYGDGISFYIAPFDAVIPANSSGGYLALFEPSMAMNTSANQIVAVEFDSFKNSWDPSPDHVGININSIVSVANVSWKTSMKNGSTANVY
ncbi:lectin 7-like [Eucalyptus grandis]|uniref:lectin 7-like n=1 Tax=Eucalyptus grandis TaxID=71139 RepID=UPI00192EEAE0|nr:lectin 7-like [Eucalyptus grandis]